MDAAAQLDGDSLTLRGRLDRAAVAALWPRLPKAGTAVRRLDLAAVDAVDSAGLALLVELRARWPQATVHGTPAGLAELRAAYRLDDGLAFAG